MNKPNLSTARGSRNTPDQMSVRIPKAAELVSKALRNQIVRGEIKEGDSLEQESELMARFGISRPTLREAIRILESERLISISRGARGGAQVHAPSVEVATRYVSLLLQARGTTMMDIYRVHILIEPAAVRYVAEHKSKTAPAVLRACIEESLKHFDDDLEFGRASARFRNKLIELAGIPTLSLLMVMLGDIFERSWANLLGGVGQQMDTTREKRRGIKATEKLIELIEAGDGAGAEDYWRRQMQGIEKRLMETVPVTKVIDLLDEM